MGVGGAQGPTGGQANDGSLVQFSGASMFKPGVPKAQASSSPSASPDRSPAEPSQAAQRPTAEQAEEASFAALKSRGQIRKDLKKKPAAAEAAEDEAMEALICDGDEDGESDDDDIPIKPLASSPGAAKKVGKVTASAKAKPSAKARPSALKRPAGAVPKVVYPIPEVTKKLLKSTTWRVWGDNIYHRSKAKGLQAGMEHADALAVGRAHKTKARDMWVAAGGSKTA